MRPYRKRIRSALRRCRFCEKMVRNEDLSTESHDCRKIGSEMMAYVQRMYCPHCGYRWTRFSYENLSCPSCGSEDIEAQKEAA